VTGNPAGQLEVEVQRREPHAVVRVRGSAGMGDAEYLTSQLERLVESTGGVVVLDLAELTFISSAGLGALIRAHAKMHEGAGQIRLVHPQPFVRQVLKMTCLDRLFVIYASLDDALQV